MKKTFATIAGAFALIAMTASVNAQTASRMDFGKTVSTLVAHSAEEGVIATGETPASIIDNKITRSFSKSFKGVTPKWYAEKDDYLARFSENGTVTHALYRKNGYMVYSVTKGSASILPREVTTLLREAYPCYDIATATKAVSLGTTAWVADLKRPNSLVVVKVIDGEIVETTAYRTND
jgi:hypothetical protein